jgi:hypothetical protein
VDHEIFTRKTMVDLETAYLKDPPNLMSSPSSHMCIFKLTLIDLSLGKVLDEINLIADFKLSLLLDILPI